jgi:hypothetical protein
MHARERHTTGFRRTIVGARNAIFPDSGVTRAISTKTYLKKKKGEKEKHEYI